MAKHLFFCFQVTSSRLKSKKFHFELLTCVHFYFLFFYLMGRRFLLVLVGQPSSDGVTIKMSLWGRCFTSTSFTPPSFPTGLVKTESGFVRFVETGLGRWMVVVAVISNDDFSFLAFSELTSHLEDTGIGVFWLHYATW